MNKTALALTILAAALPVAAQGLDNEFPYTGTVTDTRVIVRTTNRAAGANEAIQLSSGATVTVYGRSEGWLKIKPPQGCFSIIPRYAVTKDADGAMGTVTEEKAQPVFAGSTIMPAPWPYQMRLPKGSRVQILGEYVDEGRPFFKIAPPEGIYMWIPARSIQKAGSPTTEAARTEGPADLTGATDHTKPPVDAATPPPPPVDPKKDAAIAAVAQAEAALKSELAKPSGQQDLDGLLQRYSGLKTEHGAIMGDRIDAGFRAITAASKRKQAITEMEARFRTINAIQAEPVPQWRTVAKTAYAVCGTLAASEVYGGADAAYRRFAIYDPSDSTRILAYVQDATGTIDFSRYIGKNVGIVGTPRSQTGSAESVIDAREVVDLGAGSVPGLTNPVTPGLRPEPRDNGPTGVDIRPIDTGRVVPGGIVVDPGVSEPVKPENVRPVQPEPTDPVVPVYPVNPTPPGDDKPAPEARPPSTEPPAGYKLIKPEDGPGSSLNTDEYK
ncbi:MAG: hypothetical protein NTV86_21665 [Planctomycetota bacterium]|nr:hypothetical protein [Planctomycetota bacterium]